MNEINSPIFEDNPAITARKNLFDTHLIDTAKVIKNWQYSIFSHEWLTQNGQIKAVEDMKEVERKKRIAVESSIQDKAPLYRPVLGISVNDHIEIGAGRDVFLTLTALGATKIPVHIPKSCLEEFKPFLAQ